jgi:hypothetical protein
VIGGAIGVGSISLADVTSMTADIVAAFVGPALVVKTGRSMDQVLAVHSTVRSNRRIAPTVS